MAVQVLDENGIIRTLPEVSEVGARIDEKVQANMPADGVDGKDGLSIWETTTNTTTGTTSIAISTLNKVAGRSVQVGDYIIGNATYSYLYLVTAVNSTTVTVTYRRTLRGATGSGGSVTVDTALSETSENPVQNKVINAALKDGSVTKVGTATKGSSTQPIYLNAGTPTACSRTIPSITLNGKPNATPSFYAPTSAGTSGYLLKSNGAGKAPEWVNTPYIVKSYRGANSNSTWARKWSDGFIECGGLATGNTVNISFLNEYNFATTNYCVALCYQNSDSSAGINIINVSAYNKATTGFTIRNASSTSFKRTWMAFGY